MTKVFNDKSLNWLILEIWLFKYVAISALEVRMLDDSFVSAFLKGRTLILAKNYQLINSQNLYSRNKQK